MLSRPLWRPYIQMEDEVLFGSQMRWACDICHTKIRRVGSKQARDRTISWEEFFWQQLGNTPIRQEPSKFPLWLLFQETKHDNFFHCWNFLKVGLVKSDKNEIMSRLILILLMIKCQDRRCYVWTGADMTYGNLGRYDKYGHHLEARLNWICTKSAFSEKPWM